MKKWIPYFAMLFFIPAAVNAQKKPILRPILKNEIGILHFPPVNKNGCPTTCPTGMSCDGPCCMYPTAETIGQLNYIIYNKCNPIKNLHFRFEVTKEFTADYDEETNNCSASQITKKLSTTEGIVVQFNCNSKDAPNALIQYLFYVQGTTIFPHIQYAGGTPDKVDHDWSPSTSTYGITLPKANSLAKGWVLEVELTSDNDGYVTGASFSITAPDGKKHVADAPKSSLYKLRISEFQADIVSTNGHYVHYAAGSEATLSYSSKEELCVEGGNYDHCAAALGNPLFGTCETSNASYGTLSACCTKPGDSFKQSVSVK
jgi:hypothetical protein